MATKSSIIQIWRPGYRPFIMGGNVNAPFCISLAPEEVRNVRGFRIGLFLHPTRLTKAVVAEMSTGAVVGKNIKDVEKDIRDCSDVKIMRQQILDAAKQMEGEWNRPVEVSADIFFKD